MPGIIAVVRYWPHHAPIPRGWRKVCDMRGHHGNWSILIERIAK